MIEKYIKLIKEQWAKLYNEFCDRFLSKSDKGGGADNAPGSKTKAKPNAKERSEENSAEENSAKERSES